MRRIAVSLLLVLWVSAVAGDDDPDTTAATPAAEVTIGEARLDDDGFLSHPVTSPYQSGETDIRVLVPDARGDGERFPVVYVLPVEKRGGRRYGDGMLEARRADLANRHRVVLVGPSFSHLPWYTDHPSDPAIRQETYFLEIVVPFIEREYPVVAGPRSRHLVGFSKSGWGAFSLRLRHPDRFGRAVAFDAPFAVEAPRHFGMGPIFGGAENFSKYEIMSLVAERADALRGSTDLVLLGHDAFRGDHRALRNRLTALRVPHVYREGPRRRHHWSSGWLDDAVGLALDPRRSAPVRVFLLAGQSNMEGQAVVDLDHERYYNGGRGTLAKIMADPLTEPRYAHLRDESGEWAVRDDVRVWYQPGKGPLKSGALSIGYAVYEGRHHFGPELQFGHMVGDAFDEPVLVLKTAWGGKNLFRDFRPPRSGGETGEYYRKMITTIREVLGDLGTHFPDLAGRGHEIAGFVWFQGWNDMIDANAVVEYEQNLANLIADVRDELELPELPVVIAETGNCGNTTFREAQAAVARRPELASTVRFVPTSSFLRAAGDSPNVGHGHHWFGNAESYFLIGEAMAEAMLDMVMPLLRVVMRTELGEIEIAIDERRAPVTARNFLRYVDKGRFDGARFYRVVRLSNQPDNDVKIEVIQGGLEDDEHPARLPPIRQETTLETGLRHEDGVISMAREAPGTETSEFFICVGDQPELDFGGRRNPDGQGFAAFGRVVRGMDVVRRIHERPARAQTLEPRVGIESMAVR